MKYDRMKESRDRGENQRASSISSEKYSLGRLSVHSTSSILPREVDIWGEGPSLCMKFCYWFRNNRILKVPQGMSA